MKHLLRLTTSPFQRTKSNNKLIEGRLNDEKRRFLKVGDELIFQDTETREELKTKITRLEKYKTFADMYDNTKNEDWDWSGTKEQFTSGFYKYYSKEDESKYGTIAIYYKLI